MGQIVNNFLIRSLEGILEGVCEIRNTNGDLVCGSNGNNKPDCGLF